MKRFLLLLVVLYSTILFANERTSEDIFNNGEKIYKETCISCHGINGNINSAVHLVLKPRKLNKTILTLEQSFEIIKEGAHYWGAHSALMPPFKYMYDDDTIMDVAFYISEKFNKNIDEKTSKLLTESSPTSKEDELKMLKVGSKIFKRNCSLCHGVSGNGDSVYIENSKKVNMFIYPYDLTRTLLNENQIFLYVKFGGKFWGTDRNYMPSWKKKYNDFELKSVAKYVNEKIKNIKE